MPPAAEVARWLEEFAAAVRAADYARGAALFDPDALGFGTLTARAQGLDVLLRDQWQHVWGSTEGFRFDLAGARIEAEGDLAYAAAGWSSTGFAEDGAPFPRAGRATVVLRRGAGRWRAVHTHFSLSPAP
ncbi:MAG TPA: nuclear transport factor 2 family protein [Planctomycetota bacterium]|nr:nuclear transport factor 2 family protein [Planctomycetota bacterium]